MKTSRLALAILALTLFVAACGDDGSIEVEDARYRLAREDLGAAYMTVTNDTGSDVTLQSATADGVGRIEIHETIMNDDGSMGMEEQEDGFTIADGETIVLEPGGKHLMLFDPTGSDDLTISLDFGDEIIEVDAAFDAEASAGMNMTDDMDHGDMEMDDGDMDDGAMSEDS